MATPSLTARVAAGTAGRDRVLDAVRVGSLVVVMVAHSLAWNISDGQIGNILEQRPQMAVLTWGFQILGLFFAAGAVSNAAGLASAGSPDAWLARRLRRLLAPVLVYATVWSAILLPVALFAGGDDVAMVGKFLSQLLWFAGVYLVVVAAAPWTVRHQGIGLLAGWLGVIALVDAVRLTLVPALGWLNLFLVWGWLHQVGYRLPQLRRCGAGPLLAGAGLALAIAVALALAGPYSNSMVTYAGDTEPSNLAPPTMVVACHGLALILLLAAAWRRLDRLLAAPALWTPVALLGGRGIGLYLWHIPVVGVAAGAVLLLGVQVAPLSAAWWGLHGAVACLVIAGAWVLAGAAQRAAPLLDRVPLRRTARGATALTAAAGLAVLALSVTGFASWWTTAMLGIGSSTPLVGALLWLIWRVRPRVSPGRPGGG